MNDCLREHRAVIYDQAKAAGLPYPDFLRSVYNKKHDAKRAAREALKK